MLDNDDKQWIEARLKALAEQLIERAELLRRQQALEDRVWELERKRNDPA
jgi:hypothetical protein